MNRIQFKKDSIFEPRPNQYKKNISHSNLIIETNQKTLYLLQSIKIICIIFSLIQIFNTGLYLVRKNIHVLTDNHKLIDDIYIILWLLFIVNILPN
jgi:hypothetical protein